MRLRRAAGWLAIPVLASGCLGSSQSQSGTSLTVTRPGVQAGWDTIQTPSRISVRYPRGWYGQTYASASATISSFPIHEPDEAVKEKPPGGALLLVFDTPPTSLAARYLPPRPPVRCGWRISSRTTNSSAPPIGLSFTTAATTCSCSLPSGNEHRGGRAHKRPQSSTRSAPFGAHSRHHPDASVSPCAWGKGVGTPASRSSTPVRPELLHHHRQARHDPPHRLLRRRRFPPRHHRLPRRSTNHLSCGAVQGDRTRRRSRVWYLRLTKHSAAPATVRVVIGFH